MGKPGRKLGSKLPESVKAKMRISAKKSWTPERRKAASERMKNGIREGTIIPPMAGHAQSEFQKKQVSEAQRGRKVSTETKNRISESWKRLSPQKRAERILPGCIATSNKSDIEKRVRVELRKLKVRFKTQQIFNGYIVDFHLYDHQVALEVEYKAKPNKSRDTKIRKCGLKVLHIINKQLKLKNGLQIFLKEAGVL